MCTLAYRDQRPHNLSRGLCVRVCRCRCRVTNKFISYTAVHQFECILSHLLNQNGSDNGTLLLTPIYLHFGLQNEQNTHRTVPNIHHLMIVHCLSPLYTATLNQIVELWHTIYHKVLNIRMIQFKALTLIEIVIVVVSFPFITWSHAPSVYVMCMFLICSI